MTQHDYEMLIWHLEEAARDQPAWFRLRVLGLSLLAYLLLFALLSLLSLFTWVLLAWAWETRRLWPVLAVGAWALTLMPTLFITLRMVLLRMDAPQGRELRQAEAPKLFKLLAQMQRKLKAPPIHQVLITRDFNAAISQVPRFGLFGGHRNYLILGLPFLLAMSPQEMLAVIAHEYGHLAGSHGKLSAWIYRQRRTFNRLYDYAAKRRDENMVNGLVAGLLDSFAPRYNAYTFVLSRQNEYEADQVACELTSPAASAAGLTRSNLLAGWLSEQFWPRLYEQAAQRDTPGFMPFTAMRKLLASTRDEWATRERLQRAWQVDSDLHDTHPCLRERVRAMDQPSALPPHVEVTAADAMLGELGVALAKQFDQDWWAEEKANWQDYYRRRQRNLARISELQLRPLDGLDASEAQQLALLLAEHHSVADAKPVLENLLSRDGERYPKPIYYYGRVLLDEGNPRGLEHLQEAYRLSPALGEDCARAGYNWLCQHHGQNAADEWLARFYAIHADD